VGLVEFGHVHLSYDSDEPSFQFRDDFSIFGVDARLKFGSSGARACLLYCDDDGCSETDCIP
jgi:hypothetical protein